MSVTTNSIQALASQAAYMKDLSLKSMIFGCSGSVLGVNQKNGGELTLIDGKMICIWNFFLKMLGCGPLSSIDFNLQILGHWVENNFEEIVEKSEGRKEIFDRIQVISDRNKLYKLYLKNYKIEKNIDYLRSSLGLNFEDCKTIFEYFREKNILHLTDLLNELQDANLNTEEILFFLLKLKDEPNEKSKVVLNILKTTPLFIFPALNVIEPPLESLIPYGEMDDEPVNNKSLNIFFPEYDHFGNESGFKEEEQCFKFVVLLLNWVTRIEDAQKKSASVAALTQIFRLENLEQRAYQLKVMRMVLENSECVDFKDFNLTTIEKEIREMLKEVPSVLQPRKFSNNPLDLLLTFEEAKEADAYDIAKFAKILISTTCLIKKSKEKTDVMNILKEVAYYNDFSEEMQMFGTEKIISNLFESLEETLKKGFFNHLKHTTFHIYGLQGIAEALEVLMMYQEIDRGFKALSSPMLNLSSDEDFDCLARYSPKILQTCNNGAIWKRHERSSLHLRRLELLLALGDDLRPYLSLDDTLRLIVNNPILFKMDRSEFITSLKTILDNDSEGNFRKLSFFCKITNDVNRKQFIELCQESFEDSFSEIIEKSFFFYEMRDSDWRYFRFLKDENFDISQIKIFFGYLKGFMRQSLPIQLENVPAFWILLSGLMNWKALFTHLNLSNNNRDIYFEKVSRKLTKLAKYRKNDEDSLDDESVFFWEKGFPANEFMNFLTRHGQTPIDGDLRLKPGDIQELIKDWKLREFQETKSARNISISS